MPDTIKVEFSVYYFGCKDPQTPGHGLYVKKDEYITGLSVRVTPWGSSIDGQLLKTLSKRNLGRWQYVADQMNGWTVVSFEDFSGDSRPGSNSAFLIPSYMAVLKLLTLARQQWPEIFNRHGFPVPSSKPTPEIISEDIIERRRQHLTNMLSLWIKAKQALYKHPQCVRSSPPGDDEEGRAYRSLSREYEAAWMELWQASEIPYAVDGFADEVWHWRYCKVMTEKVAWLLLNRGDDQAAQIMKNFHEAETKLVALCGLTAIYK